MLHLAEGAIAAGNPGFVKRLGDLEADNRPLPREPGDFEQQFVASGNATENVQSPWLNLDFFWELKKRVGALAVVGS
jgi:hypothetical protein